MEKTIWMIFIVLLIVLFYLLYTILKKEKKKRMILFIPLAIYFLYSFFTINGATRLSIALYGHPMIAYTTNFKYYNHLNDTAKNKKYVLPTKNMDDLPSYFECRTYGIIKITTYYGFKDFTYLTISYFIS